MVKLEEGEEVVYTARRHWFLFASESIFLLLLAAVPAAFLLIPSSIVERLLAETGYLIGSQTYAIYAFFWSLWLMFLWIVFSLLWTDYYLDIWVITNHRVIDMEQLGLFNRHVSSFRYDQIQDATVKVSGLLATLIGFGTVELRTASNETFKFKGVANPNFLKERIVSEHHRVHSNTRQF